MAYIVIPSKKCQKSLRKYRDAGRQDIITAFVEVTALLQIFNAPARLVLREEWRDHALKGSLQDFRELHIGFDTLLLYRVHEEQSMIELSKIVTHEELKKQKR